MAEQSFLTMPMSYLLKVCNDLFSVLFVSRFMKWINCFAKKFFCCCCCCCCCRRCCCIFSRCCYLRWWWRRCCCSCLCCRWLRCRWFEQVGSNGIDWYFARRNIVVKSGDVLGYYGWKGCGDVWRSKFISVVAILSLQLHYPFSWSSALIKH